jgi:hypothetical protein
MLELSFTVTSRYYYCCTDGSVSPGNYGYTLVYWCTMLRKGRQRFQYTSGTQTSAVLYLRAPANSRCDVPWLEEGKEFHLLVLIAPPRQAVQPTSVSLHNVTTLRFPLVVARSG